MVFQNDGLYPHLTVGDSIRFALKGKLSASEIQSRLDTAVALTHIEAILDRFPNRLSGGELRRARDCQSNCAARRSVCLTNRSRRCDAPVRYGLQDDILRWHAEVPGTSIHVTHDAQEALRMADRIAVMEAGRIVQFATPREIYSHPQTVSVSQAIGSPPINLLRAKLVRGTVDFANPCISCPAHLRFAGRDRDLIVGVRPESFHGIDDDLRKRDDAQAAGISVDARLISLRTMQHDVHVYLQTQDDSILAIMSRVPEDAGAAISLAAQLRDVHFFDAQSGRRIEPELDC